MTRSIPGSILLTALVALIYLYRRQKARNSGRNRRLLQTKGYVPITMEDADPDAVSRMAGVSVRIAAGVAFTLLLFVIAAVVFFGVNEPMVRTILTGTLVVLGIIVLVWTLGRVRR